MAPRLVLDISMSLDGYVAGPDATLDEPLGIGGERLHDWVIRLKSWRERHGLDGGETGPDDEVTVESIDSQGAVIMGRRMFSSGEGPWSDDPNADGWWGDDPPFHVPVFVLTSHARDRVEKQGATSFTFVTDGIESALEQAREAAGEKDVALAGGANVAQQYLRAGLVDEAQIHVVPLFLGGGVRLFDELGPDVGLEQVRALEGDGVAHLRYRRATRG
jgi:dihydrofolate reductase